MFDLAKLFGIARRVCVHRRRKFIECGFKITRKRAVLGHLQQFCYLNNDIRPLSPSRFDRNTYNLALLKSVYMFSALSLPSGFFESDLPQHSECTYHVAPQNITLQRDSALNGARRLLIRRFLWPGQSYFCEEAEPT